jgi:hypothetical protein
VLITNKTAGSVIVDAIVLPPVGSYMLEADVSSSILDQLSGAACTSDLELNSDSDSDDGCALVLSFGSFTVTRTSAAVYTTPPPPPSPSPPPPPSPSTADDDEPWYSDPDTLWNPDDTTWQIVAGCVGGGLLLLCTGVLVMRRRRRQGVGELSHGQGDGGFQDITPQQVSRQVGGFRHAEEDEEAGAADAPPAIPWSSSPQPAGPPKPGEHGDLPALRASAGRGGFAETVGRTSSQAASYGDGTFMGASGAYTGGMAPDERF